MRAHAGFTLNARRTIFELYSIRLHSALRLFYRSSLTFTAYLRVGHLAKRLPC
jgi:hypothetical protein